MQHPLEIGAHYYPPDAYPDQRSHRYRSFMIEEILTDHPDHKVSSPTGDLLKFGVHALLSARPYHSHLGKYRDLLVRWYFEIRHGQSLNLNLLLIQGHSNCKPLDLPTHREKIPHCLCGPIQNKSDISDRNIAYAMHWTEQACKNCKCTFSSGPTACISCFFFNLYSGKESSYQPVHLKKKARK